MNVLFYRSPTIVRWSEIRWDAFQFHPNRCLNKLLKLQVPREISAGRGPWVPTTLFEGCCLAGASGTSGIIGLFFFEDSVRRGRRDTWSTCSREKQSWIGQFRDVAVQFLSSILLFKYIYRIWNRTSHIGYMKRISDMKPSPSCSPFNFKQDRVVLLYPVVTFSIRSAPK